MTYCPLNLWYRSDKQILRRMSFHPIHPICIYYYNILHGDSFTHSVTTWYTYRFSPVVVDSMNVKYCMSPRLPTLLSWCSGRALRSPDTRVRAWYTCPCLWLGSVGSLHNDICCALRHSNYVCDLYVWLCVLYTSRATSRLGRKNTKF